MTRQRLGTAGEKYAVKLLSRLNEVVSARVEPRKYAGDLHVILNTGEIKRVEVKTATRNKDGYFRFTLVKDNHTNHTGADVVICLCVLDFDLVIPFVIPVSACESKRVIAISNNVVKYAGQWATYRDNWRVIL